MDICLYPVEPDERADFCKRLQASFAVAVEEKFGPQSEPLPTNEEIWESFEAAGSAAYHVIWEGKKAGGMILRIDPDTQRNALELFFISPEYHSLGIGTAAWRAAEKRYPDTKVWETVTPYFEERNIHFYVNKCGFHIVEFFNNHHQEPHPPEPASEGPNWDEEGFFRFEKKMLPD